MTELATGLAIGLGAGISPGPLLTLVVATSLDRGFAAGVRVAIAPLLTDAPIVALAVTAIASLDDGVVAALGVTGGLVVIALGAHTAWSAGRPMTETPPAPNDLWRGVVVNVLSPHPWVFWITAGGPLLLSGWRRSPLYGLLFLAGFYLLLVGSKVVVAWGVARAGDRLTPATRRRMLIVAGLALIVGGGVLLWQAVTGRLA